MSRYKTPRALEMAVKEAAKASPMDTNRAISGFYFHRFLCRVFSAPDSPYVLKGGHAVLARTLDARYTKDIDLTTSRLNIDEAIEELKAIASTDLDDFLTFSFESAEPIKAEDKYRNGFRLTFSVALGAKYIRDISIDLVADQINCGKPDLITPTDRIKVANIFVCDYPVYSVEKALADKFLGIVERHNGRPSSRIKDLVDVVIYLHNESVSCTAMRKALLKEFSARKINTPSEFALPPEWGDLEAFRYAKLSKETGLIEKFHSISTAESFAKLFFDCALNAQTSMAQWNPVKLNWEIDSNNRRQMKTIEVVAAIIRQDGAILATQRGYGDMAGGWEFPGGKIEPGESPEDALIREIHEELDAQITIDSHLITVDHDYPTFHLNMRCYLCHIASGELKLLEHSAARWLTKETLRSVDWLPADIAVIDALEEHFELQGQGQ